MWTHQKKQIDDDEKSFTADNQQPLASPPAGAAIRARLGAWHAAARYQSISGTSYRGRTVAAAARKSTTDDVTDAGRDRQTTVDRFRCPHFFKLEPKDGNWLLYTNDVTSSSATSQQRHHHRRYFLPSASRIPRGLEKIEENCRSDHYSGQSSNTMESCSSTPLNRCTSTETRWNKKLSLARPSREWWLIIFLARSEKKSKADSLIGPRVSTAIGSKKVVCCKTRIFVFFLSCRQLGYWSIIYLFIYYYYYLLLLLLLSLSLY